MSRRRTPATAAPLPLFTWAAQQAERRNARARQSGMIRLVLLENCRNADGEARLALVVPGHRLPVIFPSVATAIAAKANMETGRC
jgi:hypothetical protein